MDNVYVVTNNNNKIFFSRNILYIYNCNYYNGVKFFDVSYCSDKFFRDAYCTKKKKRTPCAHVSPQSSLHPFSLFLSSRGEA